MKKTRWIYALLCSLPLLSSCGGGGGTPGMCAGTAEVCSPVTTSSAPTDAPLTASLESLANICTPQGEKTWVRAYLDDIYLWYNDIVNVPATAYSTVQDYFYALLVRSKDHFSFTAPQAVMDQYFQSGTEVGYGLNLVNENNRLRVSYTDPGTPAADQNIPRGAEIVAIDGTPIQWNSAAQEAAMYPDTAGTSHQFTIQEVGSTSPRLVTLTATTITRSPVPKNSIITTPDNKKIGYLVFTDHIATAELPLISAMQQFQQSGIDDLVLDLRYNGGGFLYIASEVGAMIGGVAVKNKIFEQLQFNSKHPEKTNDPTNKLLFPDTSSFNTALPQLNLKRVFILTGDGTCSASESIINALSPFVQVIRIGAITCGKPYGFIQENNCGQAYFAIQFIGVNDSGQANYANGFAPTCAAADDLEHDLGNINERLLATAMSYRISGSCPASGLTQSLSAKYAPTVVKSWHHAPWRENRRLK